MPRDKVINRQTFHEGKVVLYQLENRPKQLWLCRLKVPNASGYLYRGTGTSDLYEARKIADSLFDEIRLRVLNGETITTKNFNKLLDEFKQHYPSEAPSPKQVKDILQLLQNYAAPYFSKSQLTDLNEAEVTRLFDWRRKNYRRSAPSNTTILAEMSNFKVLLTGAIAAVISKERLSSTDRHLWKIHDQTSQTKTSRS